jgi:hypothetical protein
MYSTCISYDIRNINIKHVFFYRAQLLGQLRASGFVRARGGGDIRDLNTNSENWAVVKSALCAGMYPNIIRVDRQKSQLLSSLSKGHPFCNENVASVDGDNVAEFDYLSASEIWPEKRGGFWWEWSYKRRGYCRATQTIQSLNINMISLGHEIVIVNM